MSANMLTVADLRPQTEVEKKAIQTHTLLGLLTGRFTGIDLVAARAELDRRLAAVGAAVEQRYQVAEDSLPDIERQALDTATLNRVLQERATRQFLTS